MILFEERGDILPAGPAVIQLASGALGAGLALATACPAVGAMSLGALANGEHFSRCSRAAWRWRWRYAAAAALAGGSVVLALMEPRAVSGWPLLVFALIAMLADAASSLAALPQRLSALGPRAAHVPSADHALLLGAGTLLLLRPAGWVCIAATVAILLVRAAPARARKRVVP